MKQLYHALDQDGSAPDHILIEILAISGMRTEELIRVRLRDVDFASNRLTLHHAAKGSESRTCPLGSRLTFKLKVLMDERRLKPDDLLVSVMSFRAKESSIARMLRDKFDRIKALVWPGQKMPCLHGLRHTVAKKIYDKTKDIYAVKIALGHVSVTSTERYMSSFSHEKLHNILGERF
jgi:integrase